MVRKIILFITLVAAIGALAVYFYTPSAPVTENGGIVATSTPKDPRPEPITGPALSLSREMIQQGEPVLITAEGVTSTSSVKSFTFDNRPLVTFLHEGKVRALLGIDLRAAPGTFPLVLTLSDGKVVRRNLVVKERAIIQIPFGIPEKLGGNTPESQRELILTLAQEAKIMSAIPTGKEKLWSENFRSPLNSPLVVSDPYGYIRITGNYTLAHKGADIRVDIGTPVYAMNRGLVRFTGYLRNYGHTVVIDHGLGLQTVYMHLSEVSATNGQMIEKGELLGKSGDTGYVLDPHLHLSVRIWGISVDPIKFLEIFGPLN